MQIHKGSIAITMNSREANELLVALEELSSDLRDENRWLDDVYPSLEGFKIELDEKLREY